MVLVDRSGSTPNVSFRLVRPNGRSVIFRWRRAASGYISGKLDLDGSHGRGPARDGH